MIFIFGFGEPKTYYIGPVDEQTCEVCKQTAFQELIKVTEWFTLYFIRVYPQRHLYFTMCPHCKLQTKISKDEFDKKAPFAKLNKAVQDGEINKEEYDRMLKDLRDE